ncbi:hypothetical protein QFC21_003403 [Naganishia friedmannii]|uniref:Uncharacterized protein n=1 Tax=Naganishia friedmannii TaxID=89922 RepID=A0ACC2VP41_9TREE|nr:hypothetical protein QFC21_003403 [Naganishia friedmannii]
MIGDVNLFLAQGVEEDVECEIMIAGTVTRLNYVTNPTSLPLPHSPNTSTPTSTSTTQSTQLIPPHTYPFLVRIGTSNHASINLFQRLGFAKVKTVQAFEEVEMRFGWIPSGGDDGIDAQGEGEFMACQRMKELARDKWTKRGEVVWYD